MILRSLTLPLVLSALLATAGTGQERPDFAGRWTLAADSGAVASGRAGARGRRAGAPRGSGASVGRRGGRGPRPGEMGSGWGDDLTITQDARMLTVGYAFFSRGDMQPPLRFDFALDGSETRDTVMMGRGRQEQRSTATWEGDRLVLTTVYSYPDAEAGQPPSSQVIRRLWLESPTALVVETTRAGVLGGASSTTRTVYSRGEDPPGRGGV